MNHKLPDRVHILLNITIVQGLQNTASRLQDEFPAPLNLSIQAEEEFIEEVEMKKYNLLQ
jgi:hypothetical protein